MSKTSPLRDDIKNLEAFVKNGRIEVFGFSYPNVGNDYESTWNSYFESRDEETLVFMPSSPTWAEAVATLNKALQRLGEPADVFLSDANDVEKMPYSLGEIRKIIYSCLQFGDRSWLMTVEFSGDPDFGFHWHCHIEFYRSGHVQMSQSGKNLETVCAKLLLQLQNHECS